MFSCIEKIKILSILSLKLGRIKLICIYYDAKFDQSCNAFFIILMQWCRKNATFMKASEVANSIEDATPNFCIAANLPLFLRASTAYSSSTFSQCAERFTEKSTLQNNLFFSLFSMHQFTKHLLSTNGKCFSRPNLKHTKHCKTSAKHKIAN